jgi:chaperonin cofactor prefoldin
MNRKRLTRGYIGALVTTAISVIIALGLLMNRQFIIDQLNVWQYKPSSQIQLLTTRTGMSETGKFYFYTSQPALEDRQTFNGHCSNQDTNTAILGCYTNEHIYIYNVSNTKLNGIRSVTAAHEMLHAAYQRLSDAQRASVNGMVEKEYVKLRDDKKLAARMAFYAKTEPGERDNELYAVIGTEIGSIDPSLESHYARYFSDRQKVVRLHASYEAVFTQLQTRADQLSAQLNTLSASISSDSSEYNAEVNQLNSDISTFNQDANSGKFKSQAEFDQERGTLVDRVNQLDALRTQVNSSIATYDSLQKELAGIASQSDELNRSINSSLAPAPSL